MNITQMAVYDLIVSIIKRYEGKQIPNAKFNAVCFLAEQHDLFMTADYDDDGDVTAIQIEDDIFYMNPFNK